MAWLLWLVAAAAVLSILWLLRKKDNKGDTGAAAPASTQSTASDTAQYRVTFSTAWGSVQSPLRYPPNPHTGNMFFAVHNAGYHLFRVGEVASKGIRDTSMYGTIDALMQETQSNPNVSTRYQAPVLMAPGAKTIQVTASKDFPQLSFATMIAPSPDWFAGASNVALYDATKMQWKQKLIVPVLAYDAGSDSGAVFANEPDFPEAVPQPVSMMVSPPLYPPSLAGEPIPFATLTIERTQ